MFSFIHDRTRRIAIYTESRERSERTRTYQTWRIEIVFFSLRPLASFFIIPYHQPPGEMICPILASARHRFGQYKWRTPYTIKNWKKERLLTSVTFLLRFPAHTKPVKLSQSAGPVYIYRPSKKGLLNETRK